MSERRRSPNQTRKFTANAVIVVSVAFLGVPASAAVDSPIPCPASERATLVVKASALSAESVSHDVSFIPASQNAKAKDVEIINSASLLAPRAEAAIRDAFEESDVAVLPSATTAPMAEIKSEQESPTEADDKEDTTMITRLPGVSDDDLSRFRKQMFRRDI